jgi:hypothetical protein
MLKTKNEVAVQLIADRQQLLRLPKGQLVDLILMMRDQLTALQSRVAALEKNSTNSSKPPSSNMPGAGGNKAANHHRNSRQLSGRKSGGQPGHHGRTRELVDNPDTVIVAAP